jgi:hypothetical protein
MDLISGCVDQTSSSQAKIALFRSLFRGRDDVYPRRFESRKTARPPHVEAHARDDGGQPSAKVVDARGIGAAQSQPRFGGSKREVAVIAHTNVMRLLPQQHVNGARPAV